MFDFMRRRNPRAKKAAAAEQAKVFFYDPSGYKSVMFWIDGDDVALANRIGRKAAKKHGAVLSPLSALIRPSWPDKVSLRIAADETDKIDAVVETVSELYEAEGYAIEKGKKSQRGKAKKASAKRKKNPPLPGSVLDFYAWSAQQFKVAGKKDNQFQIRILDNGDYSVVGLPSGLEYDRFGDEDDARDAVADLAIKASKRRERASKRKKNPFSGRSY